MDSDDYHVIRIENNPLLADIPGTFQLDILEWADWIQGIPSVDVLLMSPPCREFSLGYSGPRPKAQRAGIDFAPSMELVEACLDIKDHLKPDFWILENVAGASSYFQENPRLGQWRQRIGPFFFWGKFPFLPIPRSTLPIKKVDPASSDPLRANKKAKIPFVVSQEIRKTFEEQRRLF